MTDFLGFDWNFWLNSEKSELAWTKARHGKGRFRMENTEIRGSKGLSELNQRLDTLIQLVMSFFVYLILVIMFALCILISSLWAMGGHIILSVTWALTGFITFFVGQYLFDVIRKKDEAKIRRKKEIEDIKRRIDEVEDRWKKARQSS